MKFAARQLWVRGVVHIGFMMVFVIHLSNSILFFDNNVHLLLEHFAQSQYLLLAWDITSVVLWTALVIYTAYLWKKVSNT